MKFAKLTSKIDTKSVYARGRFFRSLLDCISFSQNYVPQGKFQWSLDFMSDICFVTEEIVHTYDSQISNIHEPRVSYTTEQSRVIVSFKTRVPPVLGVPKDGCDSTNPISGLNILAA